MGAKKKKKNSFAFLFFGAGEASYFEHASLTVVFERAPTAAEHKTLAAKLPAALEASHTSKRSLHLGADFARGAATSSELRRFNADIERWLLVTHAICPIDFVVRTEDSEAGGTSLSEWHHASMREALALVKAIAKRHDGTKSDREHVKRVLLDWMQAAGLAIPKELDPTPRWKRALDAGDGKALRPLLKDELIADTHNPKHRRALLDAVGSAWPPRLDQAIFESALVEGGKKGDDVVETFFERAEKKPFWATMTAAHAAPFVKEAPERTLALLDRLVVLDTAHPIVLENALWAAQMLGVRRVARARLQRWFDMSIAKLEEHEELHAYLPEFAEVLACEVPPLPRKRKKR